MRRGHPQEDTSLLLCLRAAPPLSSPLDLNSTYAEGILLPPLYSGVAEFWTPEPCLIYYTIRVVNRREIVRSIFVRGTARSVRGVALRQAAPTLHQLLPLRENHR